MVLKPSPVTELSAVAEVIGGHLQLLVGELVCLQLVDAAGLQVVAACGAGCPARFIVLEEPRRGHMYCLLLRI